MPRRIGGPFTTMTVSNHPLVFGAVRSIAAQLRHNEEWASLRIE
jgi:hypothetical protein